MDLLDTDIVKPSDERPARRDGTCFYCREPIGARHAEGCVIVSKSVVVQLKLDVLIDTPRDWAPDLIATHHGDNIDMLMGDLLHWFSTAPGATFLGSSGIEFLRDATEDDHVRLPLLIAKDDEADL